MQDYKIFIAFPRTSGVFTFFKDFLHSLAKRFLIFLIASILYMLAGKTWSIGCRMLWAPTVSHEIFSGSSFTIWGKRAIECSMHHLKTIKKHLYESCWGAFMIVVFVYLKEILLKISTVDWSKRMEVWVLLNADDKAQGSKKLREATRDNCPSTRHFS